MRTRVRAIPAAVLLAILAGPGSWSQEVEQGALEPAVNGLVALASSTQPKETTQALIDVASDASKNPSEEEGTPFTWNLEAAKFANQGFVYLRQQRFVEAEQAYAQAKERDERYQGFYEKVVWLRDSAAEGKLDEAKGKKVRDDLDLTWAQFLGWEREERQPGMLAPMVWARDPQGRMGAAAARRKTRGKSTRGIWRRRNITTSCCCFGELYRSRDMHCNGYCREYGFFLSIFLTKAD